MLARVTEALEDDRERLDRKSGFFSFGDGAGASWRGCQIRSSSSRSSLMVSIDALG